jgi:uncharacterized protein YbjQ (UPF0145 family)
MDKKGGDMFYTTIDGEPVGIQIPEQVPVPNSNGTTKKIKPGDKFYYKYRHSNKVMASTLHALPGTIIVESKPMIYSNCSMSFFRFRLNDQNEQTTMSQMVGTLLQQAQEQLLQKTAEVGCNAVLGIHTNVTMDSSGSEGNSKIVVVTMTGTPCTVMKSSSSPSAAPLPPEEVVVTAHAEVIPDFY